MVSCRISQVLFDLRTNCYQSCYVNLMCELLLFFGELQFTLLFSQDTKGMATVAGLEQGWVFQSTIYEMRLYSMMLSIRYVVCPSDKRFLLLFTFLKKNRNKKVMVFFSSCMSVKFHHELLNYIDLACMSIHGKQKQTKRTTTFFQYCNADSGI